MSTVLSHLDTHTHKHALTVLLHAHTHTHTHNRSNNLTTLCKLFLHQLYERYLQPALTLGESVVRKWSPSSSTAVKSGEPYPIIRDYMGLLQTASAVVLSLFNYTASLVIPRLSSPQNTVTLKQVLSSGSIQSSGSRTGGSPDDDGPLPSFLSRVEELLSKGLSACINCLHSPTPITDSTPSSLF